MTGSPWDKKISSQLEGDEQHEAKVTSPRGPSPAWSTKASWDHFMLHLLASNSLQALGVQSKLMYLHMSFMASTTFFGRMACCKCASKALMQNYPA